MHKTYDDRGNWTPPDDTYSYRVRFHHGTASFMLIPLSLYLWEWGMELSAFEAICVTLESNEAAIGIEFHEGDRAKVHLGRPAGPQGMRDAYWTLQGIFEWNGREWHAEQSEV